MSNNEKVIKTVAKTSKIDASKKRTFVGACAGMFMGLYKKACSVLFPANIKCIICGDDLKEVQSIEICDKCKCKLNQIAENQACACCGAPVVGEAKLCLNCKSEPRDFDISRSVFVYEDEIAKLIAGLKFNNKPYISRTLGRYLANLYKELGWEVDLIVPVPMTEARKKWRGYNQAELLAQEVSDAINIDINTETLVKIKETDEQKELSLNERRKNLRQAFKVIDKYPIKGKRILLIDDVMTTGSTADACAMALKKAHASRVFVLTIAHGQMQLALQSGINNDNSK